MTILELALNDPLVITELSNEGIFLNKSSEGLVLTYHLDEEIKEPYNYTKISELARTLAPTDLFEIIISGCPGGLLSGTKLLTTTMDITPATTLAVVIDNIASGATMVALNADDVVMTQGSSMMIHSASYGSIGKAHDIDAHVKFSSKDIKRTIKHFYSDFLTNKEIKRVLKGKEVWLDADKCTKRFKKVVSVREERAKQHTLLDYKEQVGVLGAQLQELEEYIKENS